MISAKPIAIIYIIMAFITWKYALYKIKKDPKSRFSDGIDKIDAITMGIMWPASLTFMIIDEIIKFFKSK